MFIIGDGKNPQKSTRAIKSAKTSHISSRYRYWSKANHQDLALDSTTKAILTGASSYLNKVSSRTHHRKPEELLYYEEDPLSEESGALVRTTADTTVTATNRYVVVRPWERARRDYEEWVASPLSVLGSQFFDIFTPSTSLKYDVEVKSTLYFYFKTIRPFATHLLPQWEWFDDLAQIQASPYLAYAVATFSSVFLSGMLRG